MQSTVNELAMPFFYLIIILLILNVVTYIALKLVPIDVFPEITKYIYGIVSTGGLIYWFQNTFL